jgi:hypothetical protein
MQIQMTVNTTIQLTSTIHGFRAMTAQGITLQT